MILTGQDEHEVRWEPEETAECYTEGENDIIISSKLFLFIIFFFYSVLKLLKPNNKMYAFVVLLNTKWLILMSIVVFFLQFFTFEKFQ